MSEITLEISPRRRVDVIDLSSLISDHTDEFNSRYRNALYCSYHTTAGFLDEHLQQRLGYDHVAVERYLGTVGRIFPPDAGYRHDELDERLELTPEQRSVEPRNADSHLTFMSAGLRNCATYRNDSSHPVFFIDLDGVYHNITRERRATVLGFNEERTVHEFDVTVPVSRHAIHSINLNDPEIGLLETINEEVTKAGIGKGKARISLQAAERSVGITVNEYETLLMRHDLAEVMRNPLRFMREKGRSMLRDPRSIPTKAKNYAKYDFVQVVNEAFELLGMSESIVERAVDRLMAVPAERFFGMKRSIDMFVNGTTGTEPGRVVFGKYQSPILVQWARPCGGVRKLRVRLSAFD